MVHLLPGQRATCGTSAHARPAAPCGHPAAPPPTAHQRGVHWGVQPFLMGPSYSERCWCGMQAPVRAPRNLRHERACICLRRRPMRHPAAPPSAAFKGCALGVCPYLVGANRLKRRLGVVGSCTDSSVPLTASHPPVPRNALVPCWPGPPIVPPPGPPNETPLCAPLPPLVPCWPAPPPPITSTHSSHPATPH